jgi:PAS domain S-box-containing protein
MKQQIPDFKRVFESLPGIHILTDRNLLIVHSNVSRLDDTIPESAVTPGKTFLELVDEKKSFEVFVELSLKRIQHPDFCISSISKKKLSLPLRVAVSPVSDDENFILLTFTPARENSKNYPATNLDGADPDSLFFALFELNPAALAISRLSDSKIVNANASFLQLFEFTEKNNVIGKTSEELSLIVEPDQREKIIDTLKGNRNALAIEGSIRTAKGAIKWIRASLLKVEIDGENYLLAVLLDITERRNAEEKIKQINYQLEEIITERTKEIREAEMEYRSVVEQASDGIFISDEKGNCLDANPGACQMLGYSKAEFKKMNMVEIMLDGELADMPPKFIEMRDGHTVLTRRKLKHKNGSIVPVEINARMLSNGKMLGIVRDITLRMREEEVSKQLHQQLEQKVNERTSELESKMQMLRESEEKFHKAFQSSSAGITITRLSDSAYMDVNNAFLDMVEYKREEVIGRTSTDLGLIVDLKRRDQVLQEMREKGSVRQMEMTVRSKSGRILEVLASIETIIVRDEKLAINIIYDITERKRAEEKLAEVNHELESFSYSVSHDLRAPLRSIIGYAEVLQEDFADSLNDTAKRHLTTIKRNGIRMSTLIDDLLEFSRAGKRELSKASIDTFAMVEKIASEAKNAATNPPEIYIDKLPPSYADFSMLHQVWINLISNAVKYSSKKTKPVIYIGSKTLERQTIYFIKDNGAGFNMEYVPKLFGVFQRLHGANEFEGTGVGLALVRRIIEKHGGIVWAEGVVDVGATFFFTLPDPPSVNSK